MDSIFGIGLPELILILLIAGMVMGPERIAHAARWFGRTTAQLQGISRSFFHQLNAEIDAVDSGGEMKNAVEELGQLRRQIAELRSEFTAATTGLMQETRGALDEVKQEAERTIAPPRLGGPASEPVATPPVYRIPSLANPAPSAGNGQMTGAASAPLPRRVDIADDPDQ